MTDLMDLKLAVLPLEKQPQLMLLPSLILPGPLLSPKKTLRPWSRRSSHAASRFVSPLLFLPVLTPPVSQRSNSGTTALGTDSSELLPS